ncbi:MAG: hypothetical protein JSR60_02175 [Proteobacteria bacterium]|nr:hypothetical protein [Pseudomonadota bacterium]
MAQKAHLIAAMLLLTSSTAMACDDNKKNCPEPVVLNGTLQTADFDGGVGYGGGTAVYVQGGAYGGSGGGAYAHTQAFIAAARAGAFAGASASASAHAFAGVSIGGRGGHH